MRELTSPLAASVVSLFWLEESLPTVPLALVVEELELGCVLEAVEEELSFFAMLLLLSLELVDALRPLPVLGSVAEAPAAGGVLAVDDATSVEEVDDEDGELEVLDVPRLVSLATEESELVDERDVSAAEEREVSELEELALNEPLPLTEPLPEREPLLFSELLLDVEAVGAPDTLAWAPLFEVSPLLIPDEEDDGEVVEPNDELLFVLLLLFWVEVDEPLWFEPNVELLDEGEPLLLKPEEVELGLLEAVPLAEVP